MMSIGTLATELEAMVSAPDEATGINNFADAWTGYFAESTVAGTEILQESLLNLAKTAMKGAMVGVSVAGAVKMAAGITAFWGAVSTNAVTIWVTVPPLASTTPPPNLGLMQAAILAAGQANIVGNLTLEQSAQAMAAAIHPLNLGGLAVDTTVPTPISLPIL